MIFRCLKKQKLYQKLLIVHQSVKRVEIRFQWQLNFHYQVSKKKKKNENRLKQWLKSQEINQKRKSFFMKISQQNLRWIIDEYLATVMADSIKLWPIEDQYQSLDKTIQNQTTCNLRNQIKVQLKYKSMKKKRRSLLWKSRCENECLFMWLKLQAVFKLHGPMHQICQRKFNIFLNMVLGLKSVEKNSSDKFIKERLINVSLLI